MLVPLFAIRNPQSPARVSPFALHPPPRLHAGGISLRRARSALARDAGAEPGGDLLRRRERIGEIDAARGGRACRRAADGREQGDARGRDSRRAALARKASYDVVDEPLEARLLSARRGLLRLREAPLADEDRDAGADRRGEATVRGPVGPRAVSGTRPGVRVARGDRRAIRWRPRWSVTWPELPHTFSGAVRAGRTAPPR